MHGFTSSFPSSFPSTVRLSDDPEEEQSHQYVSAPFAFLNDKDNSTNINNININEEESGSQNDEALKPEPSQLHYSSLICNFSFDVPCFEESYHPDDDVRTLSPCPTTPIPKKHMSSTMNCSNQGSTPRRIKPYPSDLPQRQLFLDPQESPLSLDTSDSAKKDRDYSSDSERSEPQQSLSPLKKTKKNKKGSISDAKLLLPLSPAPSCLEADFQFDNDDDSSLNESSDCVTKGLDDSWGQGQLQDFEDFSEASVSRTKPRIPTKWSDLELDMTTKELNRYIKVNTLSSEDILDLKSARRRKKNRLYARESRHRKAFGIPTERPEFYRARARRSQASGDEYDGAPADDESDDDDEDFDVECNSEAEYVPRKSSWRSVPHS